jgi:tetratricopeptide (TPR) repeat protein
MLTTTGRANLYRSDGSRRLDAEVIAEAGNIGLRLALLDEEMHRRANPAEADTLYPPRLFLSYKWGSAAENAWVRGLADRLTKRGWEVVFDQWRDETRDRTVEEFVSRLANCRVFVAVLSPAYVASAFAPSHPTWVFDELQCALVARNFKRLIGIVPPGELATARGAPAPETIEIPKVPAIVIQAMQEPEFDEVQAVHDDDDLQRFLDTSVTYTGPRLAEAERSWIGERFARGSDEASLREVIKRYPFVSGAWRRLIVLLRDRGELQAALDATRQALALLPEAERLPFLHEHIELLKRSGDRVGAAQAATQLIEQRPRDWVAHFHLGDLLDDANEWWAARNHLLLACRSAGSEAAPYNTLGVVYMALGLLMRASETLEHALRLDAAFGPARRNLERVRAERAAAAQADVSEVSGPLPGCSNCDAIFVPHPGRPFFCAACGASKAGSAAPCELCASSGVSPIIRTGRDCLPTRCPICRTGTITSKEKARL